MPIFGVLQSFLFLDIYLYVYGVLLHLKNTIKLIKTCGFFIAQQKALFRYSSLC